MCVAREMEGARAGGGGVVEESEGLSQGVPRGAGAGGGEGVACVVWRQSATLHPVTPAGCKHCFSRRLRLRRSPAALPSAIARACQEIYSIFTLRTLEYSVVSAKWTSEVNGRKPKRTEIQNVNREGPGHSVCKSTDKSRHISLCLLNWSIIDFTTYNIYSHPHLTWKVACLRVGVYILSLYEVVECSVIVCVQEYFSFANDA